MLVSSEDPSQLVELSYVSKAAEDMGLSSLVSLFDFSHKWNHSSQFSPQQQLHLRASTPPFGKVYLETVESYV
jgi:hypothetical protein